MFLSQFRNLEEFEASTRLEVLSFLGSRGLGVQLEEKPPTSNVGMGFFSPFSFCFILFSFLAWDINL